MIMAKEQNVFDFDHWKEYTKSFYFIRMVDQIEDNIEKVEDVFYKILGSCQKKLKNPQLQIGTLAKLINDEVMEIQTPFNSFLTPYLSKFLPSEIEISDASRKLAIKRHMVEIIDCLLLNKMGAGKMEVGVVELKDHMEAMRTEDLKKLEKYHQDQAKKLEMFKGTNFN